MPFSGGKLTHSLFFSSGIFSTFGFQPGLPVDRSGGKSNGHQRLLPVFLLERDHVFLRNVSTIFSKHPFSRGDLLVFRGGEIKNEEFGC